MKLLERYYRKAPNGKFELFGRDGLSHGAIDLAVMLLVPASIALLVFMFTQNIQLALGVWKYALLITWIVLRIVWFWIEHKQEAAMCKKHKNRKCYPWAFWKWSKARIVDMTWPLKLGTPVLIIGWILL